MTLELKKLAGIATVLAALTGGPALAQDMGEWDRNADGVIDETEFMEGWGTTYGDATPYSSWDADGDGMLTEDEFNTGIYDSYDADDSGVIEEPEFGDVGDDMGDGGFWDV
jgi:Ca2+-binding EF-hand superfamily protein